MQSEGSCITAAEANNTINVTDGRKYLFDFVFGPSAEQERVYSAVAQPLLQHFIEGYNCTVLAYGQTGSGKTYTMGTDALGLQQDTKDKIGILPRLAEDLFAAMARHAKEQRVAASRFDMSTECQFLEIYNNEIRDLLGERAAPVATSANGQQAGGSGSNLHKTRGWADVGRKGKVPEVTLREKGQQIVVGGAVKRSVPTMTELMSVFHAGCSNRTTGAPLRSQGRSFAGRTSACASRWLAWTGRHACQMDTRALAARCRGRCVRESLP